MVMKYIFWITSVIVTILVLFLTTDCKKEAKSPCVSTTTVTNITTTTATTGGDITCDNNADIVVRGVCWSTSKSPTVEGTRTTDGYGLGIFVSTLTGLSPKTLYYVRAYAINSIGTEYGNQATFTTIQ
jgi:hypothetical protein